MNFSGTTPLFGVALLAACACGTATSLHRWSVNAGTPIHEQVFYLPVVALASGLMVYGLWQRARREAWIALGAVSVLMLGNVLAPQMSIGARTPLSAAQYLGLVAYVAAGVLLVRAFYGAFRFQDRGASLLAMSGMALAVGCNCCQVTMGVTGLAAKLFPSQAWMATTPAAYIAAGALMAAGLWRIGGALPALLAVGGQALVFTALRLPSTLFSPGPGLRLDFLLKHPLMIMGALIVMGAFAYAYRAEGARARRPMPTPAVAGD